MGDKTESMRQTAFNRRKFLAGLGTGAAAGLAGCGGQPEPTEAPGTEPPGTEPPDTDTPTGPSEGGKPVIGLAVAPTTLNPLQASSVYEFYIIDRILNYGTTNDPRDQSFQPWSFTDWELNSDNVGTDQPTLTATLHDELQFHDGESLTAEDYQFTVEYMKEQQPSASLTAAAHNKVDRVELVDDYNVEIYMTETDQRWFTNILGYPILPMHIWQDVDDFSQYTPRQSDAGVIGAGAWELVDFSWENWFELEPAYDEYPPARDADWIEDGAPFIEGLRFEVFGSQNAMEQAVLNGDIDGGFIASGFTVNTALQAREADELSVQQSQEVGYNHISYNMRRVPFDDVAFRQFLNKIFDKQWVIDNPYQGVGAVAGDYVVIPALGTWRPPAATEIAGQDYQSQDRFDPVSMPDLSFPGEAGSFNLSGESLTAARDFLINHPDAKHDYSFDEGQTDLTLSPDGLELYVNGTHINEAHTNNAGEGGQGPIIFDFQPPQEDIYQARYGQQFVGLMKKIGIPAEARVKTINSQIPQIYGSENFDLFAMGWGLGVNVTHLSALYSSEGADLEGDMTQLTFNPMAYTQADDLIEQDVALMDFEKRLPIVKQICATIYRDAPTNIPDVATLLEPTNNRFDGWISGLGTAINEDSFLNLTLTE